MNLTNIRLRYWFLDRDKHYFDNNYYLNPTEASANWSSMIQFADALGDILQKISTANLVDYDIYLTYSGEYTRPPSLQPFATYIFESTAGNRYLLALPETNPAIIESTGDWAGIRIDQSNPDVAEMINMMIAGNGTTAICDSEGYDIIQINEAYIQLRAVSEPILNAG